MCEDKGYFIQRCVVFQHVTAFPSKSINGISNNVESKDGVRPATM